MLDHNSTSNKPHLVSHFITAIQHIVLDYIQKNNWQDYEGFSRLLSELILETAEINEIDLKIKVENFRHPFFSFNSLSKKHFLERFPFQTILHRLKNIPIQESYIDVQIRKNNSKETKKSPLSFSDIFPEINDIDIEYAQSLIPKLNILERNIQDAIRDALREKGATNITQRSADTPLEIADIEHFSLKIHRHWYSFVCVVKGYRSIRRKKVTLELIGHQIIKAYNSTKPDFLILVVAKELVDGINTQLTQYAQSINKPDLIIICDPLDLARFLKWRKIIS